MAKRGTATATTDEVTEKAPKPKPTLRLVKVDEMAPSLPRFGGGGPGGPKGPRDTYVKLLSPITEDEANIGELYEVAEFASSAGATLVKHGITVGKKGADGETVRTPIPDGEWEFDTRRVNIDPETNKRMTAEDVRKFKEAGGDLSTLKRHSILYARWMGK